VRRRLTLLTRWLRLQLARLAARLRIHSLRWKLTLAFTGLVACTSFGTAFLVDQQVRGDRIDEARQRAARLAQDAAIASATGELPPPGSQQVADGVPARLWVLARRNQVGSELATDGGTEVVWGGAPMPDGTGVYVSVPFGAQAQRLDDLRRTVFTLAALSTLAGALVGVVLSTGLSRRLRAAASVARDVAGGQLNLRVHASGKDEVADLGGALDTMVDRLGARIERERRFSGDVAHELRTPLTALVTGAELLGDGRPADIVRERAAALRLLVDDLLELAALDADAVAPDLRRVRTAELVRDVVGDRAQVAIARDAAYEVLVDPRRVERILSNLLDNARQHGSPPVVVRLTGTTISIEDAGPGFPDELLETATDAFVKASASRGGGSGLGLSIAARQAESMGAALTVANRPGGGASVSVTLRDATEGSA
jgi:signal transduction histidine kinase